MNSSVFGRTNSIDCELTIRVALNVAVTGTGAAGSSFIRSNRSSWAINEKITPK
jgi:hypothetical protein